MQYKTTIGLEVHVELKTRTKMFCGCANDPYNQTPNVNVCPVCLAHPGVLPVINREAVRQVLRVGLAVGGKVLEHSKFDRKSYFYPDLPKGYQISQYDLPLIKGGKLNGIELERIHLEEDTAKLAHAKDGSLVDFNRAGVPLMELVTKPVIKSADEALGFARELQLLLRYLDASDADMEKGQMRIEANISLSPAKVWGRKKLGTKVELKNINSFKAVRDALASEVERQSEVLGRGENVIQETRGWDDVKRVSFSQRIKEEAEDYRYMPEPDLPPLDLVANPDIDLHDLRNSLPELPWQKRLRFATEYGLKIGSDELERLIDDRGEAKFFEEFASEAKIKHRSDEIVKLGVNYLDSDLVGIMKAEKSSWDNLKITPNNFADAMGMLIEGSISSTVAKQILREMFVTGDDPGSIVERTNLSQISDEGIVVKAVEEVIAENKKAIGDYRAGKENALKFLVGQTISKLRGRGNPELIEKLLRDRLPK